MYMVVWRLIPAVLGLWFPPSTLCQPPLPSGDGIWTNMGLVALSFYEYASHWLIPIRLQFIHYTQSRRLACRNALFQKRKRERGRVLECGYRKGRTGSPEIGQLAVLIGQKAWAIKKDQQVLQAQFWLSSSWRTSGMLTTAPGVPWSARDGRLHPPRPVKGPLRHLWRNSKVWERNGLLPTS